MHSLSACQLVPTLFVFNKIYNTSKKKLGSLLEVVKQMVQPGLPCQAGRRLLVPEWHQGWAPSRAPRCCQDREGPSESRGCAVWHSEEQTWPCSLAPWGPGCERRALAGGCRHSPRSAWGRAAPRGCSTSAPHLPLRGVAGSCRSVDSSRLIRGI